MARQGNRSRGAELSEMSDARSMEKNIAFAAALAEIARENPVLASEAREEALGRKFLVGTTVEDLRVAHLGSGVASAELAVMAEARAKENGTSYQLALSEVARERSGLAQTARKEVLNGRGTS